MSTRAKLERRVEDLRNRGRSIVDRVADMVADGYRPIYEAKEMLDKLESVSKPHTIDCDAPLELPGGWSFHQEDQISSAVRGKLVLQLRPCKIRLHREEIQWSGGAINTAELSGDFRGRTVTHRELLEHIHRSAARDLCGTDIFKALEGKPVLPVQVAKYLLGYRFGNLIDLICAQEKDAQEDDKDDKDDNKEHPIAFWGTICRDRKGRKHVPYISRGHMGWEWRYAELNYAARYYWEHVWAALFVE